MATKSIVACLDENFRGPSLPVAIAASNFLLLETYQQRRDAQTWTAALKQSLHGLEVKIVAVTSDQAKGLIARPRPGRPAQPHLSGQQIYAGHGVGFAPADRGCPRDSSRPRTMSPPSSIANRSMSSNPGPGRAPNWQMAQRMAEMFRRRAPSVWLPARSSARASSRGLATTTTPSMRTAASRWRPPKSRSVWSSVWPRWSKSWRRRRWERGREAVAVRRWLVLWPRR